MDALSREFLFAQEETSKACLWLTIRQVYTVITVSSSSGNTVSSSGKMLLPSGNTLQIKHHLSPGLILYVYKYDVYAPLSKKISVNKIYIN